MKDASQHAVSAEAVLEGGLRTMRVLLPPGGEASILTYLELLQKWGRTYNLSAIRDPATMVTHHILDSLSAVPFVVGEHVLDVGSGAGLPGIPLAISLPQLTVTLIESRLKRTQFLFHAAAHLGLSNIVVVRQRVERYQPPAKFDTLITRAFSTIADFLDKAEHLCAREGRMIALKGRYPAAELEAVVQKGFTVQAVHPVDVPGIGAERHIVVINPRDKT